jgi:2-polyprenyl-6-hydroxyphenyl methylase/3-demethylubiquinone-9 3-methyltransferase
VAELHKLETGVNNVNYRFVSAEQLATEEQETFDVVTCLEMLEHVPDPAQTIQACANLCKPGGWLFFSTINRNPKSFVFAIVGAEYVLNLLPKGTHEYKKFIKPSELAQYARLSKLDFSEIIGLVYNPLTKVYRLARDTDVNYMVACRKPA